MHMRFCRSTNYTWPPLLGLTLDCAILTSTIPCWKLNTQTPWRLARKLYAESLEEIWVGAAAAYV